MIVRVYANRMGRDARVTLYLVTGREPGKVTQQIVWRRRLPPPRRLA